jgi:diazepam-binding inhibitor (GABA receptor modulator, acyl-CoA-binding protein)
MAASSGTMRVRDGVNDSGVRPNGTIDSRMTAQINACVAAVTSRPDRSTLTESSMATLKSRFDSAVAESKSLPERPDNMTLLRIYALYKQATEGDASGERPGMTDFKGRAKFDAWTMLKGMTKDAAMQAYVDLIEELK